MPAKVEWKAVLATLVAKETEVKDHTLGYTLSELKGMKMLETLSDKVALNVFESLGDTEVKVNTKTLVYQVSDREAEVKVDKLGETRQQQKMIHLETHWLTGSRGGGRDTWQATGQEEGRSTSGDTGWKRNRVASHHIWRITLGGKGRRLTETLAYNLVEEEIHTLRQVLGLVKT